MSDYGLSAENGFDTVLFLYREGYYAEFSCEKETAEIIIAKNCFSETVAVPMEWTGSCIKFSEEP